MNKISRSFIVFLLLFTVLLSQNNPAAAQENWDIRFNLISPIESTESMTLKVYFTLSESHTDLPVTDAKITSAQIALLNTDYTANATVKKPDIPIYIALVMDASGSMGGSSALLKDAAKLSLNDIPDDSLFSVIQFDENIKLLQDFTKNIAAVSYAIDAYQVSNKGTCLYDAAYAAIESMSKLPEARRAVILFTDGKDEKVDGSVCSQHKYQEMIDLAMKSQVPLNTIGLSTKEANINSVELTAMSAGTGGFSSIASKDDLPAAFSRIMTALKAQWMAEAVVYPKNGSNNAVLTIALKDSQTLNAAFTVESGTDYPGPPSPVTISLDGLLLNAARQSYEIQLGVTSPELAEYIKVEVWDKDGGAKVGEYVFENPVEFNSYSFPTEALTVSRGYQLRISAVSKENQTPFVIATDDQGNKTTQLIHEFTFDPTSAYPSLEVQSIVAQSGDLVMTMNVTNIDLIGGFDGWLVDETTNTKVEGSNFSSQAFPSSNGTITIPMQANRIPDGKYSVVVRVLAKNNNVYTSATVPGITYKAPSIFKRLGAALFANPIVLVGILVIVVVVVGFLMISSSRQKHMSGTPVLQGQLGGGLKQNNSFIPVADHEPIPMRQANSAVPPPPVIPPVPPPVTPSAQANFSPYMAPPIIPSVMPPPESPISETAVMSAPHTGDETVAVSSRPQLKPYLSVIQKPFGLVINEPIMIEPCPFIIGRTEGNINIQDVSISRRHALISYEPAEQKYFITDLNSKNNTTLNEKRLIPEQPIQVNNGDLIGIGPSVIIRFNLG